MQNSYQLKASQSIKKPANQSVVSPSLNQSINQMYETWNEKKKEKLIRTIRNPKYILEYMKAVQITLVYSGKDFQTLNTS